MAPKYRLAWIDAAKGVAIMMVVCIHTNGIFQNRLSPSNPTVTWWILNLINTACRVCVPLFFMLSGAVILGSPERSFLDRGYVRRIWRTLAPLLVWSLVYLIIYRMSAHRTPTVNDVLGIAAGKAHHHLWFLYSISGLLIVSPMLNAYVCATGHRGGLTLGILWLTVVGISWVLEHVFQFMLEPNFTRSLPVYTGYFVIGYALRDCPVTRKVKFLSAIVYLDGLVACALLVRSINSRASQFEGLIGDYVNPLVMIMSIAMFLLFRPLESAAPDEQPGRCTRFFARLGVVSLGVYTSHVLILDTVVRVAHNENRLGLRTLPYVAVVPILMIIVIALSWEFSEIAKRIPILRHVV
ncbi:MAG: acyltransferase family protein [Planctomycetota bacterium]